VRGVAIGRAGDRDIIVSGSDDGIVYFWSAVFGDSIPYEPFALEHWSPVYGVTIGRAGDRRIIVSGCEDAAVRIWDTVTGEPAGPPGWARPRSAGAGVAVGAGQPVR
jgi:WD40 repeat protein